MTKEQLTEFLERTRSMLDADLDTIVDETKNHIGSLNKSERAYAFNCLQAVSDIGDELLENIDGLIKQLCK